MTPSEHPVGRRALVATALAAFVVIEGGFILIPNGDYFFKVNKGIEIFGRVYKEIAANYVDEVDPERFARAGIEGMLETLDPYTVYIGEEEGDEVDLLTNGKYGGIGVTIGTREGGIEIITVMEGYSAQRQGMAPGDRLLSIDGVDVTGKKPDEVRSLTRGEPGTEVRVVVHREGESSPLTFVLVREEIKVLNVTYAEHVGDGVGYIRLERFSRRAGDEVKQAIKELKLKGDLKGIILDVRGNPGGLLDAAVDVTSKFVRKGDPVVTTRGRRNEADKTYSSTEEPLLPETPLVVLINGGSASASEIVAGAIQDLDRGLIIGERSFGKGLVQTILPLSYGAQLKITTARYYVPSGRSIQEIDYMHRNKDGVFTVVPESLRHEFRTRNGRKVFELGGIKPDSVVPQREPGPMMREISRRGLFFRFANKYVSSHKGEEISHVTDEMMKEFREFLAEKEFTYHDSAEEKARELLEMARSPMYSEKVRKSINELTTLLENEKKDAFQRNRDELAHALEIELMSRVKGEAGRIGASLKGDTQIAVGRDLLKNPSFYRKSLGR